MARSVYQDVRNEALPRRDAEHRSLRAAAGDRPGHGDASSGRRRAWSAPQASATSPLLGGVSVLVVDDDEASRDYFAVALQTAGATVETAGTALEAIQMMHDGRFDVVLSDIAMPGHDGYWLVQEIRGLPDVAARNVPVVATTAYGRTHSRERVLEAGFVEHLSKPVEPNALRTAIARAAGRST